VIVLAGWGLFLLVLAGVELLFDPTPTELALEGGVGLAALLAGLALGVAGRRARSRSAAHTRAIAEGSMATMLAAIGVACMAFGAEAGPWLVLVGAGVALVGAGELARERRAERG
jgi:uncharacterized membrane protein HdeD (DUF308 family)